MPIIEPGDIERGPGRGGRSGRRPDPGPGRHDGRSPHLDPRVLRAQRQRWFTDRLRDSGDPEQLRSRSPSTTPDRRRRRLISPPARPRSSRRTRAGTPAATVPVGQVGGDDRPGPHGHVPADGDAGEDHGVGSQPGAGSDADTGCSSSAWRPIGRSELVDTVVLVGDVDVGSEEDIVVDDSMSEVGDDAGAPADQAAIADADDLGH